MEKIFLDKQPFIGENDNDEKVIALGYFDGMHLGHRQVIQKAVEVAREKGLVSAVMTFYPHPSVVLSPSKAREDFLTPLEQKAELIEKLGVDLLIFVHFDLQLSRLSPQDFVDHYLIKFHAKHVVAGYDFTFGRMAEGNMDNIDQFSRSMFSYTTVPKVERFGEKVSTTHIRRLITEGAMDDAAVLLGRPYRITGTVGHGDQRGRTLGFPTANVETEHPYVMPSNGIYAVRITVGGKMMDGVCSIGTRPTFYQRKDAKTTVEVFVLNFSGDLYGQSVSVDWYKRLRGEIKFSGADELIAQMETDKRDTAVYFETLKE
ncbi:bifunctional riboflavin kinase/FAD synthetase [Sporolactobacillus shoreae]|uniref:Riboflavin biosynthesis protein n=1 Tax=Sporolactobacillus shoreae TaxID=1465501 RepID=A0A4Z0GUB3_9BACL|nr:bifunctional riboflavin kinase/FAD synthetase [Sporolactobacillus shoreae]TGB00325.1 bifunctional riboflavin kinase/FAD synthetase [Sporolactobacillus shoreae]